jgi:two-component system alkaline phosphatase synthesis response regulator PhoP
MGKKRILIVDDEKDIVETTRFKLESEGFECLAAYDGEEALSKAKKENPDLIILDVMLPKMNGYKIARLLKFDESHKDIPIIMLTAKTQETDIKLGEETGADEYVTKPFDLGMLVALVKKHLGV